MVIAALFTIANQWIFKETVAQKNGTMFSLKREVNLVICDNMYTPDGHVHSVLLLLKLQMPS